VTATPCAQHAGVYNEVSASDLRCVVAGPGSSDAVAFLRLWISPIPATPDGAARVGTEESTGPRRAALPLVTFAAATPQFGATSPPPGGSPSGRHRHYAAPTTPANEPRIGANRPAVLIGESRSDMRACTSKQRFVTLTSN
jgi:hypothetical protein